MSYNYYALVHSGNINFTIGMKTRNDVSASDRVMGSLSTRHDTTTDLYHPFYDLTVARSLDFRTHDSGNWLVITP
jgi:hypothetical protein